MIVSISRKCVRHYGAASTRSRVRAFTRIHEKDRSTRYFSISTFKEPCSASLHINHNDLGLAGHDERECLKLFSLDDELIEKSNVQF